MKINNFNFNKKCVNNIQTNKQNCSNYNRPFQTSVKIPSSAYWSYITNSNISFENKKSELQEFNKENLSDIKIEDEFDWDEGISQKEYINVSCLTYLASDYIANQIRHIEQTGELIPYKAENIKEENKYASEEEIQSKIEEEKQRFLEYFHEEQQRAISEVNKVNPTKKEHTLYRIINNDGTEISKKYIEKINALQKDDEVVLNSTPMFVSTSAKGTMGRYGKAHDGILFEIKLPKNSKIVKFPSTDGINQLLMKPDAKFKIIDNQEFKNNFRLISLEYLND